MRYIFTTHDRPSQVKRIREGIEGYRTEGASRPDDFLIHPLYDDILQQLGEQFLGYWSDEMAIVALGGYGRKEMSPYSDIDVLFLTREDAPMGMYGGIRNLLHLLWDSKVEIGHSVRTVEECTIEANKDLAVLTSLMDVRLVWGNDRIFRQLKIERERLIRESDPLGIYLSIEAEIRKSLSEFGHTIYRLEPYVKEGPGSLRYIQLIAWLMRMIFGSGGLDDLPVLGLCGRNGVEEAKSAMEFLAGVRARLHFLASRRDDRLNFEAQSVLAGEMGFEDTPDRRGVERFMRVYYRHAATNELFGQRMLARVRLFLRPKGGSESKRMKLDDSFYIGAGGINRFEAKRAGLDPRQMLRAFQWVAETGSPLDIRLTDLIRTHVRSLSHGWEEDPDANSLFLNIFQGRGSIAEAATAMMQTGFLEGFIPDFGKVRYLRQHDAYHLWTVDKHTMETLRNIDDFGRINPEDGDSLPRRIFSGIDKPEVLYLAGLFHDMGKGRGPGHEMRGEEIARPMLERFGMQQEDVEDSCFLIRNHLAMTHMAFKKDLHDVAMLVRFAENLMHKRLLDMLMLLTHADLMAVGPDGFNSWRGMLLEELYYRTLDVFEGESAQGEDLGEWLQQIKTVVREQVPAEERGPELDLFLGSAPSRYLLDFYPAIIADHFLAVGSHLREHGKTALGLEDVIVSKVDHHRPGYSSITLIVRDRLGLFYREAGTLAANRINILGAWSHTVGADIAIGTFHVNDIDHAPLADPERWEKFQEDIRNVIGGEADVHELVRARQRSFGRYARGTGPRFPLKVEIDNAASGRATIVEVYAHDRPGLLYDITRCLSSLGLDIVLTKITTEVDQAADVFYVQDEHKQKIVDFDRLDQIRNTLRKHLIETEAVLVGDPSAAAISAGEDPTGADPQRFPAS